MRTGASVQPVRKSLDAQGFGIRFLGARHRLGVRRLSLLLQDSIDGHKKTGPRETQEKETLALSPSIVVLQSARASAIMVCA